MTSYVMILSLDCDNPNIPELFYDIYDYHCIDKYMVYVEKYEKYTVYFTGNGFKYILIDDVLYDLEDEIHTTDVIYDSYALEDIKTLFRYKNMKSYDPFGDNVLKCIFYEWYILDRHNVTNASKCEERDISLPVPEYTILPYIKENKKAIK